jgi:hypothetical protein
MECSDGLAAACGMLKYSSLSRGLPRLNSCPLVIEEASGARATIRSGCAKRTAVLRRDAHKPLAKCRGRFVNVHTVSPTLPQILEVRHVVANADRIRIHPRCEHFKGLMISQRVPTLPGLIDAPAEAERIAFFVLEDTDLVVEYA